VDIVPALARKGIESIIQAAKRAHPEANYSELMDGTRVDCDYLGMVFKTRAVRGVAFAG
jgi:sulfide:quinone oxidoreductase